MKKRYNKDIPLEETVVAPLDIFNSKLLVMVKNKYNGN
jgi:hypothetical protein